MEEESLESSGDCCRYCYMEGSLSKPLFYPCHCSGSMRYVHQECLDRWLSHNDRPTCEVCGHRFQFKPIYKEDMPSHLPIKILFSGLGQTILNGVKDWLHYTLVAIAWLIVVPLSAYRIYKFIFNHYGLASLLSLTGSLVSPDHFLTDVFYGAFIVSASIAAFVALVWLREQIINGAAPEWMDLHLGRRGAAGVGGVAGAMPGFEARNNNVVINNNDRNENIAAINPNGNNNNVNINNPDNQPEESQQGSSQTGTNNTAAIESETTESSSNAAGSSSSSASQTNTVGGTNLVTPSQQQNESTVSENDHTHDNSDIATESLTSQVPSSSRQPTFQPLPLSKRGLPQTTTQNDNQQLSMTSNTRVGDGIPEDSSSSSQVGSSSQNATASTNAAIAENQNAAENDIEQPEEHNDADDAVNENENDQVNENAEDEAAGGDIFEQAAEELTWDRMLGLDGSLVFLEHVFWVISLNGLFIFLFIYCPYNIGKAISFVFSIQQSVQHLQDFINLVFGYIAIAFGSFVMYFCSTYMGKKQLSKIFGISYITVKVVLLMFVEIGVFPLLAGVWIDICTLKLFDVPWSQRAEGFKTAPITSVFIHWMVGMVFVFYYASFVITLREVLRPGVLWFMRNFTDPEFNPVFEMIKLPIISHLRRFILSGTVFGTTCMLSLFFPVITIRYLKPKFLPYQLSLVTDAPVSELSMELLLLQVILPALLDQGYIHIAVKSAILVWTKIVGSCLDLRSYLLGANDGPIWDLKVKPRDNNNNEANNNNNVNNNNNNNNQVPGQNGGGLQAAHLALLQVNISDEPEEFRRPTLFPLRITLLIMLTMCTVYVLSCIGLFFPTYIGRKLMSLWFGDLKMHELYTCAIGVYACWAVLRTTVCVVSWISAGIQMFKEKIKHFIYTIFKLIIASVFCIGLIPLLLGIFFDILVVLPLRLSPDQTPIYFLWQSWALGILHSKIFCAVTLIGPNWWLKTVMERVGRNGLIDLDLQFLLRKLVAPVVALLVVLLSTPYFLAFVVIPIFSNDILLQNVFYRRFYHTIIFTMLIIVFFVFQVKQMRKLYVKIKNDRYLIGQRLQNLEKDVK